MEETDIPRALIVNLREAMTDLFLEQIKTEMYCGERDKAHNMLHALCDAVGETFTRAQAGKFFMLQTLLCDGISDKPEFQKMVTIFCLTTKDIEESRLAINDYRKSHGLS